MQVVELDIRDARVDSTVDYESKGSQDKDEAGRCWEKQEMKCREAVHRCIFHTLRISAAVREQPQGKVNPGCFAVAALTQSSASALGLLQLQPLESTHQTSYARNGFKPLKLKIAKGTIHDHQSSSIVVHKRLLKPRRPLMARIRAMRSRRHTNLLIWRADRCRGAQSFVHLLRWL